MAKNYTLEEIAAVRRYLPERTRESIARSRKAGATWAEIAERLEVSVRGARLLAGEAKPSAKPVTPDPEAPE